MGNDIYGKSGTPVGFHDRKLIYDLWGHAVGQLRGSRVYCMAGHYVGKLKDGIILDKNRSYPSVGARGAGSAGPRGASHASGMQGSFMRKV